MQFLTLSGMTRLSPDLLPSVKTGQESDIPQTIFDFKYRPQVLAMMSISPIRYLSPNKACKKIRINRVD